jgi:hypothetical protein
MLHFCANFKYETKYTGYTKIAVQGGGGGGGSNCGFFGIFVAKIGTSGTSFVSKKNSCLVSNHASESPTEVHVQRKCGLTEEIRHLMQYAYLYRIIF